MDTQTIPIPPEPHTVLTEAMQQSKWFDTNAENAMISLTFNATEFRAAVSLFAARENLGILPYETVAQMFAQGFQSFATGLIESAAFGEVTRPVEKLLECCAEAARSPRYAPRTEAPVSTTHTTHQALAAA